jgi:uncharacterized membrane protein YvbJ
MGGHMTLFDSQKGKHDDPTVVTVCTNCGTPIHVKQPPSTQTIEKTSKKLKLHLLLATMLFWWGLTFIALAATKNVPNPEVVNRNSLFMGLGAFWYCITRLRIWWQHE